MKAQLICNGKTIEVEVANEQFEKLFADKKTGYERVNKGSHYYGINAMINAQSYTEYNGSYEKNCMIPATTSPTRPWLKTWNGRKGCGIRFTEEQWSCVSLYTKEMVEVFIQFVLTHKIIRFLQMIG